MVMYFIGICLCKVFLQNYTGAAAVSFDCRKDGKEPQHMAGGQTQYRIQMFKFLSQSTLGEHVQRDKYVQRFISGKVIENVNTLIFGDCCMLLLQAMVKKRKIIIEL